ncbi:MAG: hypothetical protein WC273_09425 [Dehalococcoidia bacterium]
MTAHRRGARLLGWAVALHAVGWLAAVSLGEAAGEVARRAALLCGLG